MTDIKKKELQKEILLEEHEANQEVGLYSATPRGNQEDFRALSDHLSTLLSYLDSGWNDPTRHTELIQSKIQALTPTLSKYNLTDVTESCKQVKAAWDRLQTARQRKRDVGMI